LRKLLWFLLSAVLLAACARQASAPCVTVAEQTLICGGDTLVEDIRMPVLSGFEDKSFEASLNARIQSLIKAARQDAQVQAQIVQQWVEYVCVLTVDYDVKQNCGLFSMRLTCDLENGGTGFPQTVYFNADIQKNALLMLDDLFVSEAYREALAVHITESVRGDERFSPEDFLGIDEKTAFYTAEGRLYIAFAKYEIASGMTGEPVFEIPEKLIRDHVKPEYKEYLAL